MKQNIRVVLADDHPIVLAGLRNLIEAESDLDLVGEATNGQAALTTIWDKRPDVAVVDISMPEINGIELAKRLAKEWPDVRVLVLTLYEERSFVMRALAAGVKGYVLKRSAAENLVHAIRAVMQGELYIDPSLTDEIRQSVTKADNTRPQDRDARDLTEREASVLKFLARGLTIKEIAGRLELSAKTVDTYKARASEKLHLKSRADIVRFASAQGWLENV
jgi:DNA-binding NarL/FixJ family response regulator